MLTVNRCMGDIAMSKRMWKGRYHLLGVDNNDQYETPVHVFDYYNGRYHFYRDVCATKQNAKAMTILHTGDQCTYPKLGRPMLDESAIRWIAEMG